MSSRRLHIVHTEASCGWGGQEIRILTEAAGLIERGHRVELLCPQEATIYQAAAGYGVPVTALPIGRKNLRSLWAMRQWLRQHGHRVDVLNTHSSTDSWLVALANCTLSHPAPVVRTRHVSSPINTKRSTFWLYQSAVQHLVVTGQPLLEQLVQQNGFAAESMTSIPTGIDLSRFTPGVKAEAREVLGIPEGRWLGILATLRDWKGHEYLFEALAQLQSSFPELRLLVIGDGPYRDRLDARLGRMALGERVWFVGQQSNPERWLQALDLFVLPSYGDEGVSQAVMQAMACQLPVITTPIGGMADAVQHEHNGIMVPPKNSEALAGAIRDLLLHPERCEQLAKQAHQDAQARFGRDVMLNRMEAVFQRFARKVG